MKIIKEYTDYLKDNPEGYWFKRKLYGWGWTPVKWQGWLAVALFVAYMIWNSFVLDFITEPTGADITWFYVKTVLSVLLLIMICYKKGEKPKWQWGRPKSGPLP